MCDLWKNTLPHALPPGAVPRQIDFALSRLGTLPQQVKLYNSGSFFDTAAIPLADYPAIADGVSFAENVIVESHPRLVGEKALRLRDRLRGSLEVAMGLETIHPKVLPRLNKKFTLDHFSEAAAFLRLEGIAVRAFVLVKPPFLNDEEAIEWAVKSCEFAFGCGAGVVSLIPTRPGNGALDRLRAAGEFGPPELRVLEQALETCLRLRAGRVFADTWDLEQFSVCRDCLDPRRERLQTMNLSQEVTPAIGCMACKNGSESHALSG
jgi:radical SAM enzyme (TIGR01210 family)